LFGGIARSQPLIQKALRQHRDGFAVGFAFRRIASTRQFGPQLFEVFDDPVVHDGHRTGFVGMRIFGGRAAVGGPSGVADAGFTGQGIMDQKVRQVDQFANGATTIQNATVYCGDARAVIAAIFQTFQRLDQRGGGFVVSKNADNTTHGINLPIWRLSPREALKIT